MRRVPITEEPANGRVAVDTGASEFDAEGGVYTLFYSIPRPHIAYFKLMIEAYEGIAVGRTMRTFYDPERTRALVVVMVVPDFLAAAVALLEGLAASTGSIQVPATPELQQDLRRNLGFGDGAADEGA